MGFPDPDLLVRGTDPDLNLSHDEAKMVREIFISSVFCLPYDFLLLMNDVISKILEKKLFFVFVLKGLLTKRPGSGAGSGTV